MKGTATVLKKQASESGLYQHTSSAAGVELQPAHKNVAVANKPHPPPQLKSKPNEQMKDKIMVVRRIYVIEKPAGGYRKYPTDVHVVAHDEHLILQQYLAEFNPLCEEGVAGYQPSVQASY